MSSTLGLTPAESPAPVLARDAPRRTGPVVPAQASRRIHDLPHGDRPRERLARSGPAALAARELVALVLGSGVRGSSVLDLSDTLVRLGLRRMARLSLADLETLTGLGRAKAARLLACFELGARLAAEPRERQPYFRDARTVARYLLPRYAHAPVETFGALLLDVRSRLQRELVLSVGCLTGSVVHPREVFREATVARAARLIVFHNHPSGDPEPSSQDLALTRRLAAAGLLMGIDLTDHIVLGAGSYVSLRERGVLPAEGA